MLKIDGMEVEAIEKLTIGEIVEAEKYLRVNMNDGSGAALAVMLFPAIKKLHPEWTLDRIATEVMAADITNVEETEDPPVNGAGLAAPHDSATGGDQG